MVTATIRVNYLRVSAQCLARELWNRAVLGRISLSATPWTRILGQATSRLLRHLLPRVFVNITGCVQPV